MVNKPVIASTEGQEVLPTSSSDEGGTPEPEDEAAPTDVPNPAIPEKTMPPAPIDPFPTTDPGEDLPLEIDRPLPRGATPTPAIVETQITDKNPGVNEFFRSQKIRQNGGASVSIVADPIIAQAEIEGEVHFTESDQAVCQFDETWYDATVVVSLPEGVTAKLVTSWYVVHPSELNPGDPGEKHYVSYPVQDGDSVTFAAWWPGVRAGDGVVEIHRGAALVYNGEVLDTASLDYYWYDWVCQRPTSTPTATDVPTQETLDETPTPVPGDEATPTPGLGDEMTPTNTTGGIQSAGTPGTTGALGTPATDLSLATLPAPQAASDDALLIPVTGADLTGGIMLENIKDWQDLFVNFGLLFLGIAFVLQGFIHTRTR